MGYGLGQYRVEIRCRRAVVFNLNILAWIIRYLIQHNPVGLVTGQQHDNLSAFLNYDLPIW